MHKQKVLRLGVKLIIIMKVTKSMLYVMEVQPTLIKEICVTQATDPQPERIREEMLEGKAPGFMIHENSTIRFHNRVCVPAVEEPKKKILDEGHNTPHSVHPGAD